MSRDEAYGSRSFFSLRRPCHAGSGLASGLKSIVKGTAAGAAAIVAGPVLGFQEEGGKGCLKGFGLGSLAGVLLPITGCLVGVTQTIRGLVNTPSAIHHSWQGLHWDPIARRWTASDPTVALVPEDSPEEEEEEDHAPTTLPAVHDLKRNAQEDPLHYYAALGIGPSATAEEIKRNYYLVARRCHPDKCPDDREAHANFQHLTQAYQVLSDPRRRAQYDRDGTASSTGALDVAPGEFFAALFGLDALDPWVGELIVAASARLQGEAKQGGRSSASVDLKLERAEYGRRIQLIKHLDRRIKTWRTGADGRAEVEHEVGRLVKLAFGEPIMTAVGRVYVLEAQRCLGGVQGVKAQVKTWGTNMRQHVTAARLGWKLVNAQARLERKAAQATTTGGQGGQGGQGRQGARSRGGGGESAPGDSKGSDAEEKEEENENDDDDLGLMLKTVEAATLLDVTRAVSDVCRRLLGEGDRATVQALAEMGEMILANHQKDQPPLPAKKLCTDAMQRAVEKKAGQD